MDDASRHLTDEQTRRVQDLWRDQLQPIPADLLGAHVPAATRAFLTEVGLPMVGLFGVQFFHDHRICAPVRHTSGDYLAISSDGGTRLAVEARSGQLWKLGVPNRTTDRFINSNLGYFVLFTGMYRDRIGDPPVVTWQQAETISNELRRLFGGIDPASLVEGSLWRQILNDIDRG
jgi:hypothetical protein